MQGVKTVEVTASHIMVRNAIANIIMNYTNMIFTYQVLCDL